MRLAMRLLGVSVLFWLGCAQVISENTLRQANRDISFEQLRKDPVAYKGQTVVLGGVIVKASHDPAGTLLEVYQTETDWERRPVNVDVSGGRFLAFYKGFLDSEIYEKGRKVTIAGEVTGERTQKLGEIDYRYPFLLVKEIHLWKRETRPVPDPYVWYPWGPWGPWGPWYYPYWPY